MDALIDGIDWDEEIVLTPVKTTKMTPKTPKRMSSSLVKVIQVWGQYYERKVWLIIHQSPLLGKLPVSRIPKSPLVRPSFFWHIYDFNSEPHVRKISQHIHMIWNTSVMGWKIGQKVLLARMSLNQNLVAP